MNKKIKATLLSTTAAITLFSTSLYADVSHNQDTDEIAVQFVTKSLERFKGNPNVKFSNIGIKSRIIVPEAKGMTGYIVKFNVSEKDKTGHFLTKLITDSFYVTEEGMITTEVFTSEGRDMMVKLLPNVDYEQYYKTSHIVAGDINATNKILLFSDPFCPFCREAFPKIVKKVNADPKNYVLYMFEYPLSTIHPGSEMMIAAMMQAKDSGQDITAQVYRSKELEKLISNNSWEALAKAIKKETGFQCNIEKLKTDYFQKMLKEKQLGDNIAVSGTPFLIINKEKVKVNNFLRN